MSASGRRSSIGLGAAATIAGVLMVKASPVDADHDGENDIVLDDNLGLLFGGTLLAIAGAVVMLAGATAQEPAEPSAVRSPLMVTNAPGSVVASAAPPVAAPSPPPTAAPLPELPATPAVLHLAQQARAATALRLCDSAWDVLRMIDDQDARYAAALLNGPAMASCRR